MTFFTKDKLFENMMTDTSSPCFFCSQESRTHFKSETVTEEYPNRTEPVSTINLFCLQNISRFLHLFEKYGEGEDDSRRGSGSGIREAFKELKVKLSDFDSDCVVPVCENCSEMTKDFSELYDVLLEARRQLECCIQKMHDAITKTMNNEPDVLVIDDDDNEEDFARIGEIDTPKTKRKNLRRKRDRAEIEDPLESIMSPCLSDDDDDGFLPESNHEYQSTSSIVQTPPFPDQSIPVDVDNCSYCRYEPQERGSFSGAWMLRLHVLQYHCEHYFPKEKLEKISVSQYKKIICDLLFKDLINEKGYCAICRKNFPGSKGIVQVLRIKSHLVESHHEELAKKLLLIQKDPNLLGNLSSVNPHGMMCDCGVYLPDKESQTNHNNLFCKAPQTLEPRPPSPKRSRKMKIKRQKIASEPDHMSNFTQTTSDKEKVTCKLCNKTMNRKSTLWHYTYSCRKGLLRCPPGKNFTALMNQGTPFSCNYCRKEFAGPKRANLLIHHWIRFHPEHFFLDEMNNLKGVTKHQFQMILHNILFPEVQSEDHLSCNFCDKKFNSETKLKKKYLLRKHLLYEHNSILRKRLEMILKDPKLMESLSGSSSSSKGVSCHCGMYISSWNKSSQYHHKAYHCNLSKNPRQLSSEGLKLINEMDEFTLESGDDDEVAERQQINLTARNKQYGYPTFFDKANGNRNPCPFCRAKVLGKLPFQRHLILYHCKYLFPKHKLDFVEDSVFQKILVELLFKDLDCDDHARGEPRRRCHFCKEQFRDTLRGPTTAKGHYITKHYKELEKILEDIQNDPDVHEILERCNPSGEICKCGIYFSSKVALVKHQARHCIMTEGANDKLDFLQGHKDHPPGALEPGPEIITIDDDDDDDVEDHRNRNSKSENEDETKLPCSYCKAKLSSKASLQGHMLHFHLKHFFPSHKLDSVTDSQFQKILADILFQDYEDAKKTSCMFCTRTFKIPSEGQNPRGYIDSVKKHMIQFHFHELEERLEEIQRDPDLPEIMDKCNVYGWFCELCGMYSPKGENTRKLHDKFHCLRRTKSK